MKHPRDLNYVLLPCDLTKLKYCDYMRWRYQLLIFRAVRRNIFDRFLTPQSVIGPLLRNIGVVTCTLCELYFGGELIIHLFFKRTPLWLTTRILGELITLKLACPAWTWQAQLTCIWLSLPGASGLGNQLPELGRHNCEVDHLDWRPEEVVVHIHPWEPGHELINKSSNLKDMII